MKLLLSGFLWILFVQTLSAQKVNSDTLPYKVVKYDIKKQEKVLALAQKLEVDPNLLVRLNKFRNAQSILVKGQRIKIPVYPKASKEVKKEKEKKEPEKKDKKEPKKEEVKKPEQKKVAKDNVASISTGSSEELKMPQVARSSDIEKDKVRLILIDATLELNEAMMEGVKASLDAMDIKAESNGKNGITSQQKAKLTRDRSVVMPYILHIQDSLSKEIARLKAEKKTIEERISPPQTRYDTVLVGSDIVVYEITTYPDNRPEERMVKQMVSKEAVKLKAEAKDKNSRDKKYREHNVRDTIIVYDLASVTDKNSEREKVDSESENRKSIQQDIAHTQALVPNIRKDSTVALKIKIPNTNDSVIIKPVIKSTTSINTKSIAANRKSNPALSSADSIKRIKAEFFLKRAEKAISEKNYKNAEQYLEKSIELYPDYFDAWFALAGMNDRLGSSQRALKEYQVCEKIDSSQSKLYNNIGNIYSKMKQKTEAYEAYNKALLLKPDDISTLMARASILTDWKKYTEAIADYDHVLKADRIYRFAYKARGQIKLLTKDFTAAADDFTRFLIFESTDPSAYFYRGLAKIGNDELLDGCLDLSTSAGMGYSAAEKAIKKSCE